MKIFLLMVVFIILGCDTKEDKTPQIIKRIPPGLVCIDGVEYISWRSQIAPHFKPDGSLYLCPMDNHLYVSGSK